MVVEHADNEEVKTTKQQEIEQRCLELDPPLPLEALVHLPAYQASLADGKPLSQESWEALRASLLQEQPGVGQQKRGADPAPQPGKEKPLRSISKTWGDGDSVQLLNRAKLAEHAELVIHKWAGKLSGETVPKFSAEVLLYCRKQFLADESTRRKRLTLGDMKHVFDVKVKPLAHPHRVEMFLCNGCPSNPRWWGFESLVQHFTAKHTYNPRGRSAKVNWRADWPDIGPFRSDPDKAVLDMPTGGTPASAFAAAYPMRAPARLHEEARPSSSPPRWAQDVGRSVPTAPRRANSSLGRGESHYGRLDVLAADARDAWSQLANIRDIPSSVLVHFVITRTARKYQTRFSQAISLAQFLEALSGHPAMEPIRAARGLGCIECQRNPGKPLDGVSKAERVFPIVSLLQHFEIIHVKRNKSAVTPDWTRDMVRLPHPRVIAALADSGGVDTKERYLLEDIFPWAFVKAAKNERVRNLDGAKSDSGSGHGPAMVPYRPPPQTEYFVKGISKKPTSERDPIAHNGFPASQGRLERFRFAEENAGYRSMDPNYRSARRDADSHGRRPSLDIEMEGAGSAAPWHARRDGPKDPDPYYLDQRDHRFGLRQEPDRQEGYQQADARGRISRPAAHSFMDVQPQKQRSPEAAPYYSDPHYGRPPHDPPSYRPGNIRRRSRSPVSSDYDRDRYRERYPPLGGDGHGFPAGYPEPHYTYPPAPYYGPAEMGDYASPYGSRPPGPVGYYASPPLPPPPPPLMMHHMSAAPDYYYEAQPARSGSPIGSARYPPPPPPPSAAPHQRLPLTKRPPPPNDGYEGFRRYQPRQSRNMPDFN